MLIEDAISIVQTHATPWQADFSIGAVRDALQERSLWGVIATLYKLNAASQRKTGWVCKSNQIFDFVYAIRETLPTAKFLYLVRDGRDYLCSMQRVAISRIHPYHIAHLWRDEQRSCLEIYANLKSKGVIHIVRYEDLLTKPQATLHRVCAFLGEPFESQMLDFHQKEQVQTIVSKSAFWNNLGKPLLTDNFGKFKSQLSPAQIALFESIAGHELTLLGYTRVTDVPIQETRELLRLWYELLNTWYVWRRHRHYKQEEPWRKARTRVIKSIRRRVLAQVEPVEPFSRFK